MKEKMITCWTERLYIRNRNAANRTSKYWIYYNNYKPICRYIIASTRIIMQIAVCFKGSICIREENLPSAYIVTSRRIHTQMFRKELKLNFVTRAISRIDNVSITISGNSTLAITRRAIRCEPIEKAHTECPRKWTNQFSLSRVTAGKETGLRLSLRGRGRVRDDPFFAESSDDQVSLVVVTAIGNRTDGLRKP